jgi:hypothetical protein
MMRFSVVNSTVPPGGTVTLNSRWTSRSYKKNECEIGDPAPWGFQLTKSKIKTFVKELLPVFVAT